MRLFKKKYRIKQVNGIFYPQERHCFIWWDMEELVCDNTGLEYDVIAYYTLEKAEEYIKSVIKSDNKEIKKDIITIHNVDYS